MKSKFCWIAKVNRCIEATIPFSVIAQRLKKEGTKHIFLVIADTGIGIREEDLPRICEKGYTGYNGHAHRRSTGIGLYLVNRIRKKLGHSLSVYSREGEGTKVVIGFVLADTEE